MRQKRIVVGSFIPVHVGLSADTLTTTKNWGCNHPLGLCVLDRKEGHRLSEMNVK